MKTYPDQAEVALGFGQVREHLRQLLMSAMGTDALRRMGHARSVTEVKERLGRAGEFQDIVRRRLAVPLSNLVDIRDILAHLAPAGAYASGAELVDVLKACGAMRRLREWFVGSDYSRLKKVALQITPQRTLERHLDAILEPTGEVRSSASAALLTLRRLLKRQRAALRSRLQAILNDARSRGWAADAHATVRGGRMVIPLRAEAKRKVKGFIHGSSATGQTVYVEPAACLELNNGVRLLEDEEQTEVVRILRAAAAQVRACADDLYASQECVGQMDLLHAIGRLALRLGAVTPKLNRRGVMNIRHGRSPSLLLHLGDAASVMPFDMVLNDYIRTLVITGPNAGGKTVAMKAAGLLSIMIAYGIPVPVHPASNLCLFDQVMIEIGDNQSIEHDLSTFSARMKGLSEMIHRAGPVTLVLVDEIGTGTDPAEGAALAQAALEQFTRAGARSVVTTHHGTLKAFAHEADHVQNASMEFDQVSLKPTFRFRQGMPGSSYAFLIAERLDLSTSVLKRAQKLVSDAHLSLESLLMELQEQKKVLADRVRAKGEHQEQSRKRRHRSHEAKKSLQQRLDPKRQPRKAQKASKPSFVTVGAHVKLRGSTTAGEVTAVEGTKVTVAVGSMRVKVAADRLRPASRQHKRRPHSVLPVLRARAVLDLHGKRVREAVPAVASLVDNAVRANLATVQIEHGLGTGAVYKAVHAYLADSTLVKEYALMAGNPGVTLVHLR